MKVATKNHKSNSNQKSKYPELGLESPVKADKLTDDVRLQELINILSYKRRHNTDTEILFCMDFMQDFEPIISKEDGMIAAFVHRIGDAPVMWSSHTDTVHREDGFVDLEYDKDFGAILVRNQKSCLGADDGVGIWMMLNMIRANVPGLYVFHRAEEVGGIGSSIIAAEFPELLEGIKYAIAFDRKGDSSIITHQGARCCSDEFARTFAAKMYNQGIDMILDDSGVFTDTANYTHLIPECTNISCGYYDQHSGNEMLDVEFANRLLDAIIAEFKDGVDDLACERNPLIDEYDHYDKYDDYNIDPINMRILEMHCGLYDSKMNPINSRKAGLIDDDVMDTIDNISTFKREDLLWWLRNEKAEYIAEVIENLLIQAGR